MSSDKTYTVDGLSRQFVIEMYNSAVSRGYAHDALAIRKVVVPLWEEDDIAKNNFKMSFSPGDTVEITLKDNPRKDKEILTITKIADDYYAVGKLETRVYFSDDTWCRLSKFSPDWIKKI